MAGLSNILDSCIISFRISSRRLSLRTSKLSGDHLYSDIGVSCRNFKLAVLLLSSTMSFDVRMMKFLFSAIPFNNGPPNRERKRRKEKKTPERKINLSPNWYVSLTSFTFFFN